MSRPYKQICLSIFIIGSVTCFLPLYLTSTDADFSYFDSNSSYDWQMHRFLCMAAVSTSLPLLLDTVLDYKLPFHITGPRWVFLAALIVPNSISFYSTRHVTSTTISITVCCVFCREFLMKGALLSFLLHPRCSTTTVIGTTIIAVTSMLRLYVRLCFIFGLPNVNVKWISATFVVSAISHALLFMMCLKRFMSYRINNEEYINTLYASLPFLGAVLKAIVVYGAEQLTFMVAVDIFICIIATVVPGRQARHESTIAQHTLKSKRDFVSYISHELRTPLNTVYMGIQLLSTRTAPSTKERKTEVHDIVKDIESSCCIAINILSDLLVVNKIEGGNMQLDRKDVSIRDLLSTVIDPFGIQAQQKDIIFAHSDDTHIDPSIDAEDSHIYVDVMKFSQVLRNLVSNALKFTPTGGRVDVYAFLTTRHSSDQLDKYEQSAPGNRNTLSLFRKSSGVDDRSSGSQYHVPRSSQSVETASILRIEVHDTGPGISEENQKRLFNEIVQFNAAELQDGGGSGLGLWISKEIIDHHGGRLGVSSIPGKGSVFYVEVDVLPREYLSHDPVDSPAQQSQFPRVNMFPSVTYMLRSMMRKPAIVDIMGNTEAVSEASSCKNDVEELTVNDVEIGRVLVVDDSAVNRKMMCRMLSPLVGSVSPASDGAEAVKLVKDASDVRDPYDIVFMDVNMPVMNGVEATRMMREGGYKGYISFLTGNAMPEERPSFFAAGGDDVLIKPCTFMDLQGVLTAHRAIYHRLQTAS